MPRYSDVEQRRRRAEHERRRKLDAAVQDGACEDLGKMIAGVFGPPTSAANPAPSAADRAPNTKPLPPSDSAVPHPATPTTADKFTSGALLSDLPPAVLARAFGQEPELAVENPAPIPADVSPVPPPAIVEDTSKLAVDVEQIASAAIDQIKEILRHPLDRQDPNFAALLRLLSSTFNTSMTTILRADENRLKRQAISRLPEIAARAAEERRKRDERRMIESVVVETVTGDKGRQDDDGDAA
jgi:hypothetical protein